MKTSWTHHRLGKNTQSIFFTFFSWAGFMGGRFFLKFSDRRPLWASALGSSAYERVSRHPPVLCAGPKHGDSLCETCWSGQVRQSRSRRLQLGMPSLSSFTCEGAKIGKGLYCYFRSRKEPDHKKNMDSDCCLRLSSLRWLQQSVRKATHSQCPQYRCPTIVRPA